MHVDCESERWQQKNLICQPSGNPAGVHPEDWNSARDPGNPDQRWSPTEDPADRDVDGRQNRKDRKKNRNQVPIFTKPVA
jgi:hypothetical protein